MQKLYLRALEEIAPANMGAILQRLTERNCESPGEIWSELKRIRREAETGGGLVPNPDFYVTRRYAYDEVLPWDFIDHHIHKWFLLSERRKAHYEHQTKPCDVHRCTVCGAC